YRCPRALHDGLPICDVCSWANLRRLPCEEPQPWECRSAAISSSPTRLRCGKRSKGGGSCRRQTFHPSAGIELGESHLRSSIKIWEAGLPGQPVAVAAAVCDVQVSPPRIPLTETSKRQPLCPVFPLRCFRRQPDQQEFVDCRPHIEALRNEEYTGAMFSSVPECTEVSWHRTDIV